MKKLLVIGLISSVFSAGAFAAPCPATPGPSTATIAAGATTGGTANTEQCICDGGPAKKNTINGGSPQASLTTPIFVQRGFDVQCSANTIVSYNEVSPTGFAVGSGSRKGNRAFKGSTAGGGIAEAGVCPTTGCTATEVSAANVAATNDSSS